MWGDVQVKIELFLKDCCLELIVFDGDIQILEVNAGTSLSMCLVKLKVVHICFESFPMNFISNPAFVKMSQTNYIINLLFVESNILVGLKKMDFMDAVEHVCIGWGRRYVHCYSFLLVSEYIPIIEGIVVHNDLEA